MEHDLEKARNLKVILSAFQQLSWLKFNYQCFASAKPTRTPTYMMSFLAIGLVNFILATYTFRYIFGGLLLLSGSMLRRGFRSALVVGKKNCYPFVKDWFSSIQTNTVLYIISFFQLSKGDLRRLDYF
jgi:hypothetical protein